MHIVEHDVIDDDGGANRQPPPAAPAEADDVVGEEDGKGPKKEKKKTTTTMQSGEGDGIGESMRESSTGMNGGGESSNEAEEHKAKGNTCFAEGRWAEAERHYTLALEACIAAAPPPSDPTTTTTTTAASTSTSTSTSTTTAVVPNGGGGIKNRPRAVYHANRAACYMGMERYQEAVEDCTDAIAADDGYAKAYLRRGAAREKLQDLEGALADNEKVADELEPGHAQAAAAVARLRPAVERKRDEMKEEMMGKLKDLGNSILGNFGLSTENFKAEKDDATGSYNIQFVQNP